MLVERQMVRATDELGGTREIVLRWHAPWLSTVLQGQRTGINVHPAQVVFASRVRAFRTGFSDLRQRLSGAAAKPARWNPAARAGSSKYVRRKADFSGYVFAGGGWLESHEFAQRSVFHLMRPDINQEVCGQPEHLSSLHAA